MIASVAWLRVRVLVLSGGLLSLFAVGIGMGHADAADVEIAQIEADYGPEIQPLIKAYCVECHSAKRAEADVDLTAFATWSEVKQQPEVWIKVGEMLDSAQMPPRDAKQPSPAEFKKLQQWVRGYLRAEARARAGDPGRVVLRRLNNVEYTNTLRDLTGLKSLNPAREFPIDSAAGEGFTNTGGALAMSPSLVTKYLDAAKEVAAHAVLLPDGFRFSAATTRSDWTNETLAAIRQFYGQHTSAQGGTQVNLQGIVFDTNGGGRLPLEAYVAATLAERDSLMTGSKSVDAVAQERHLKAKYLRTLWQALTGSDSSLLLDGLRARWRNAKPSDAGALVADIARWQQALFRFTSVGHIGKVGGPKRWLEPVSPLTSRQEIRLKLPAATESNEVVLSFVTSDLGDGNEHDVVVWQQPRLVAPGRPDLPLSEVRELTRDLSARRVAIFSKTTQFLAAAAEASKNSDAVDVAKLAAQFQVEEEPLRAWLEHLGIGGAVKITGHFTQKFSNASGYDFIKGWGSGETPNLAANSSDQHVRIPGKMKPHSVAVHPSPTLRAVVGWQSPVAAKLKVEAAIAHAHPECGNGVMWWLELRRGATRQRLAAGISQGNSVATAGPIDNVTVQPGDVISLVIGPRDGNHSCDLTAVDLKLTSAGEQSREWDLAKDVSSDVLAGNPHADRFGNANVWHFYTEPETGNASQGTVIPTGSILARWLTATAPEERQKLAAELQALLTSPAPQAKDAPDTTLYRQLTSLSGPLFSRVRAARKPADAGSKSAPSRAQSDAELFGLDPAVFGKRPDGSEIDPASLCVRAPSVVEVRLPADLVAGCELVTAATLEPLTGADGSVQAQVVIGKANAAPLQPGRPIIVSEQSATRQRIDKSLNEYRDLFPAALCYARIVPVDEVVTLTLFYREDDHLRRLLLDDAEAAQLDRLWDELHYVSHDALTLVDAYAQLMEYATQDADPKVFEPLRKPIHDRAAAFKKRLVETEPIQLEKLIQFAARAYRRPLTEKEVANFRSLYGKLRGEGLPHDDAWRFTLARVLVSPAFLYRAEKPRPGTSPGAVSDWELANRLSYFLWSTMPDAELQTLAAENKLHDSGTLVSQARRMLRDGRVRQLSNEFACQWLGVRTFDSHSEKSEQVFPTFTQIRGDMHEESVRFFVDLFQRDGSILEVLNADHTFLNEALAKHYGIPGVTGSDWRRVDGVKKHGRGGILTLATTLTQQSGASRTSPILRGNWVVETLLGEKLPKPPKDVPQLPEAETDTEQTVRQLVEKHRSVAACAHCHDRIDPFGFALEGYDAIGRKREKDLGGRVIDVGVELKNGVKFSGADGLRDYLLEKRRDDFVHHFCRKLLGYALGRTVQLSDEPLLEEMQQHLQKNDYRFSVAVERILVSPQFLMTRGADFN